MYKGSVNVLIKYTNYKSRGFSFVELISVLIIFGVLSAVATGVARPNHVFQMQASRDQLVSAFFLAQQRAMVQRDKIQLSTSGQMIDIRQDKNNNNIFENTESIRVGTDSYPVTILNNQSLDAHSFVFNRLGQTNSAYITLSQNDESVTIYVSSSGFIR